MSVALVLLGGTPMHSDKNVTKPVNEALHKTGYDAEEEYFFQLNSELIERNRRRLDEQRKQLEAQERMKAHWLMCPKCGSQLKESDHHGVKADVCEACCGIFLDKGELEHILESHSPSGFSVLVKKWLAEATKPQESGIHHFPV
jgi:Zn-finger nucleic acid-binding protein